MSDIQADVYHAEVLEFLTLGASLRLSTTCHRLRELYLSTLMFGQSIDFSRLKACVCLGRRKLSSTFVQRVLAHGFSLMSVTSINLHQCRHCKNDAQT